MIWIFHQAGELVSRHFSAFTEKFLEQQRQLDGHKRHLQTLEKKVKEMGGQHG